MISSSKVALLLSYICIASISAAIITPALPHIQTFFHLSKGSVEWVVSLFLLGYVLGQLIYAPIANRYGRLKALRAGLLINLLGILICMIAANKFSYSALLAGRFITALGAASGLSCTFMLLNELLPSERAKRAISFSIVSITLGIGLSVLLGSLITQYFEWQDCFILLFIHGVFMLALSYLFPETLQSPKAIRLKLIFKDYLSAFKNSRLMCFSLAVGFVSFFSYGFSASAPLYTHNVLHLSPSQYGYWNIINMIGMCGSGFLSAFLIKKLNINTVLKISIALITPALILLITLAILNINNTLLFFLITSYLYLTAGLLFPVGSYLASTAISDKAVASSAMSFINMGSAMTGVIIMSYLPFKSIISFTTLLCGFFMMIILFLYLIKIE